MFPREGGDPGICKIVFSYPLGSGSRAELRSSLGRNDGVQCHWAPDLRTLCSSGVVI